MYKCLIFQKKKNMHEEQTALMFMQIDLKKLIQNFAYVRGGQGLIIWHFWGLDYDSLLI